jgi:tetratricopeptide (TPR) repeat protein
MEKKAQITFAFVGVAGTWDMNYLELKNLTADLRKRKANSRMITFDGGHDWPPTEAAVEAIEWMELAAIRNGFLEVNQSLVDDMFQREVARAQMLEESGQLYQAFQAYLGLERDFSGLKEIEDVSRKVAALKQNRDLASSAKRVEKAEKIEREYIRRLLGEFLSEDPRRSLHWWRDQIESIRDLEPEHPLVKKRLLEFIWRNGYEKSWFAEKDGDRKRATHLAQVALLVEPEDPHLNFNLARLQAQEEDLDTALETLKKAIASGWNDRSRLESDPAFATLRNNVAFQKILDRIGSQ